MGGFRRILRPFLHSVRMDVSALFSAIDDEEFFVVEGSGVAGMPGACSQVFCHSNYVHALAFIDKDIRHTSRPYHNHHHHHNHNHHHHPRFKQVSPFVLLLWPVCLHLQWAP